MGSILGAPRTLQALAGDLARLIPGTRIPAVTRVIRKPEGWTVTEVMWEESREAEVVFLGLMQPEPGEEMAYAERLLKMAEGFPSVVLVRNSGWFAGELV